MMKKFLNPTYGRSIVGMIQMILPGLLLLITVFLGGCQDKNYANVPEELEIKDLSKEQKIKRGEYLVSTIGCADCHSPKSFGERGPEEIAGRQLSGFQKGQKLPEPSPDALQKGWMLMSPDLTAAVGPWGTSFAANITSHETGIGNWSLEQFKTSIRKGKYKGMENARDLLPPMPWFNLAKLTDEDLEAMYHYLQSTEPVDNIVPAPIPPAAAVAVK